MAMAANGLAKLLEECGELSQIAAKKLAYFDTDEHPDGAGSMKTRLEDELADVCAAGTFVIQTFGLDSERVQRRAAVKLDTFQKWHRQIEDCASERCKHPKGWHRAGEGACLECGCLEYKGDRS